MTRSTSPTSSGSSAEVGSSNSITCGLAWRAPGRSRRAAAGRPTGRPDSGRACHRCRPCRAAPRPARPPRPCGTFSTWIGASMTFSQHRHVRPEIEALEHHAEPAADALDLAVVDRRQIAFPARLQPDLLARDEDAALRGQLEQVDAAQQRALAGAGGADDGQTSPSRAVSDTPRSTSSGPKRLCRSSMRMASGG